MLNDRFAQLIAKQLSGEATEEELGELESSLANDPSARAFYDLFREIWKTEPRKDSDNIQQDIHFQQILSIAEKEENIQPAIHEEAELQPRKLVWLKPLLAAAVLVGIAFLGYQFLKQNKGVEGPAPVAINKIEARKGARSFLLLPDGTKVWLNSDSRIEYDEAFNGAQREVVLIGEAYFDVVKDPAHPFIVHTSDIDIRVLGTAFNVKSYPKESSIEATLIHGLIEVTNKKEPASPKLILRPHEKLVYQKPSIHDKDTKAVSTIKPFVINALPPHIADSALVETSWVYNKLIFDGETFGEIALKMERWYNKKIVFRNSRLAAIPIHYTIANESVEEALKAMQFIEDFTFKIKENQIEIY